MPWDGPSKKIPEAEAQQTRGRVAPKVAHKEVWERSRAQPYRLGEPLKWFEWESAMTQVLCTVMVGQCHPVSKWPTEDWSTRQSGSRAQALNHHLTPSHDVGSHSKVFTKVFRHPEGSSMLPNTLDLHPEDRDRKHSSWGLFYTQKTHTCLLWQLHSLNSLLKGISLFQLPNIYSTIQNKSFSIP